MIMYELCFLRFPKCVEERLQTLLREFSCLLRPFRTTHNVVGYRRPARLIARIAHSILHYYQTLFLFAFCPLRYLGGSQEKDVTDSHMKDCRSDDKPIILQGFPQILFRTPIGARIVSTPLSIFVHSLLGLCYLSIPNIVSHCKKYWNALYQFFPKTVRYFLQYTSCAFQTSKFECQAPAEPNPCGVFSLVKL